MLRQKYVPPSHSQGLGQWDTFCIPLQAQTHISLVAGLLQNAMDSTLSKPHLFSNFAHAHAIIFHFCNLILKDASQLLNLPC